MREVNGTSGSKRATINFSRRPCTVKSVSWLLGDVGNSLLQLLSDCDNHCNQAVALPASGRYTALWLGHWSNTVLRQCSHEPQLCQLLDWDSVGFTGRCRHGEGQASGTSEPHVSCQATCVFVAGTLVAHVSAVMVEWSTPAYIQKVLGLSFGPGFCLSQGCLSINKCWGMGLRLAMCSI